MFQGLVDTPERVIQGLLFRIAEFSSPLRQFAVREASPRVAVSWPKPSRGFIKLNVDITVKGNSTLGAIIARNSGQSGANVYFLSEHLHGVGS